MYGNIKYNYNYYYLKDIPNAIARAGSNAKIGQTYGTNSIIPAINGKISLMWTQNSFIKKSQKVVMKNIQTHKMLTF